MQVSKHYALLCAHWSYVYTIGLRKAGWKTCLGPIKIYKSLTAAPFVTILRFLSAPQKLLHCRPHGIQPVWEKCPYALNMRLLYLPPINLQAHYSLHVRAGNTNIDGIVTGLLVTLEGCAATGSVPTSQGDLLPWTLMANTFPIATHTWSQICLNYSARRREEKGRGLWGSRVEKGEGDQKRGFSKIQEIPQRWNAT